MNKLTIIVVVILLSRSVFAGSDAEKYAVATDRVYTLAAGEIPTDIVSDSSCTLVAIRLKSGNRRWVWNSRDGSSPMYDYVDKVQISRSGILSIIAVKKDRFIVNVGGREFGPYDTLLTDSVIFSPDGTRSAFIGCKGSKRSRFENCVAVVDGSSGPTYESIADEAGPLFSPDGAHVVYFAIDHHKFRAVVDNKECQPFEMTGVGPVYINGFNGFGYMGVRNDTAYLVVNDSILGGYYDVIELVASATTDEYAYTVRDRNKGTTVFHNGAPVTGFAHSRFPLFSPDGLRFSHWATDGQMQYSVVDGISSQPFGGYVSASWFSADSRNSYFLVVTEDFMSGYYVLNGTPLPTMRGALKNTELFLSPTGTEYGIAYDIDSAHEAAIVNGVEYTGFKHLSRITFSPDGRRCGFIGLLANSDSTALFLDSAVVRMEGSVGPNIAFSPDGEDVFYWRQTRGDRTLCVSGDTLATFRNTMPLAIRVSDDGSMCFFAIDKTGIDRVTISRQKE